MRKAAFAVIAMILVLVFGTMTSYGTIDDSKAYGYTVTVYSGEQGHFGGSKSITITGDDVNSRATFFCELA